MTKAVQWSLLVGGALLAILTGLVFGATFNGPAAFIEGIRAPESMARTILVEVRLPRVVLAFVVGGGLGIAGAALQALVRNPLADPYLLGLSGGAGLGAVLAIAVAGAAPWAVPTSAFVGALTAIVMVYRLSVAAGRRLDPRVLLLVGVVVGSFAGAIMSAIMVLATASELRNAFLWLLGGFSASSWQALGVYLAYATIPVVVLMTQARRLDLLTMGEETAQFLGADVERTKRVIYVTASLLTAAAVAVSGMIGFVGLVVPHAMRRLVGPLHTALLPAVFLASGGFLVLADSIARSIVAPIELPVGVVTALVGVPLFALLLRRTLR
jgi:iron complex transport system permease protein